MGEHLHEANVSTTACPECLKAGEAFMQRAQRGYADRDVWSFDVYLAKVIAGGLTVLRNNLHGCPPELCSSDDKTWAEEGVERWQAILGEIIAGFAQYTDEDGERSEDVNAEEFQRSFELLGKWWGHLWD